MTRNKTRKMSIRVIESLPGPDPDSRSSNIEYSVAQESNLILAVYKNGSRSWRFKKTFRDDRLFITIGAYPVWGLEDAIERTREFKRLMDEGIDPREQQYLEKNYLFGAFIDDHFWPQAKGAYKSATNIRSMLDKRILDEFGNKPIARISKRQIADFHRRLVDEVSGVSGNRYLSTLSSIFQLGVELDLISTNPCRGVKKAKENKSRDRYLLDDEYVRFIKVAHEMIDRSSVKAILILSVLGLRKSELLSRTWDDLSFSDRLIYIRDPKNGESRYVALNTFSYDLLKRMHKERDKSSPWIFPSRSGSGHLLEVRRTFDTILKKADIKGLRLHDLRRSHATHLLNSGVDIVQIKEILGHKDLRSTQVYARLKTASLAKTSELASKRIEEAINHV